MNIIMRIIAERRRRRRMIPPKRHHSHRHNVPTNSCRWKKKYCCDSAVRRVCTKPYIPWWIITFHSTRPKSNPISTGPPRWPWRWHRTGPIRPSPTYPRNNSKLPLYYIGIDMRITLLLPLVLAVCEKKTYLFLGDHRFLYILMYTGILLSIVHSYVWPHSSWCYIPYPVGLLI